MRRALIWQSGIGRRWSDSQESGVQSTNSSWAFLLGKEEPN
jgi:hypothetical protein